MIEVLCLCQRKDQFLIEKEDRMDEWKRKEKEMEEKENKLKG